MKESKFEWFTKGWFTGYDFHCGDFVMALMFVMAIGGLFFIFTPNPLHATTCPEIDDILTQDLKGEIELDDTTQQDLLGAMNWCMDKGYEPYPLTFQDK